MTTNNIERFINIEEAANFLSSKKNWLYQNHKRLGIPSYKIGRKLLFKVSELDNWIKNS